MWHLKSKAHQKTVTMERLKNGGQQSKLKHIIKYMNSYTTSTSCPLELLASKPVISLVSKLYSWQMGDFLKSFVVHVFGYQDSRFDHCEVGFENNPQIQG